MSPLSLILYTVSLAIMWFAIGWLAHRRSKRNPYRYRCPHCPFTASSTDMAILDRLASIHTEGFHPNKADR